MKKTLCIFATVICLAWGPPCHADVWYWGYFTQPYVGETYAAAAFFGAGGFPPSSDGYDINDQRVAPKAAAHIGVYYENGVDSWTGPTGFWAVDLRAETVSPLQLPHVWDFYVWMDPEVPESLDSITFKWYRGRPPAFVKASLQFVRNAVGVPEHPLVGSVWDLMVVPPPDSGGLQGTIVLPAYRTDDGRNGYLFRMTAEVIPEPSSLVVLGGVIAAAGGLRRQRLR